MKFAASLLTVVGIAQANFRSGSVSTYEKFRYGKFVTRMKAPDRKGTVASFFTYWDGPNFNPLQWNELDMEIVPSVTENPFSMNIIYGDGRDKVESHDYAHSFNPHSDWHVYAMEWTPHYISWKVDGKEMRHVSLSDPALGHLDKAQSLRMNFWTPTFDSWGAGFNPADMPWYVLYDYVEVFTYDERNNQFVFHWRDDFDSFDSGKWHKAAGGFESNTSVFHPDNAYTSGGHLVLKMEPEHTKQQDAQIHHDLEEAFGMDLDHRKRHYERLGHNYVDSESQSEDEQFDHHDLRYIDHHDDYYRGEHGDLYVDHHDQYGEDHRDQRRSVSSPHHAYDVDYDHHYYAPSHHDEGYYHGVEHGASELETDSEAELDEYLRHVRESLSHRDAKRRVQADPHYPGHHPEDKPQERSQPAPADPAPQPEDEKTKLKAQKKAEKQKKKQMEQDREEDVWHLRGALPDDAAPQDATVEPHGGYRKVHAPHGSAKEIKPSADAKSTAAGKLMPRQPV